MSKRLTQNPAPDGGALDELKARAAGRPRPCPDDEVERQRNWTPNNGPEFDDITADRICREAAGLVSGERAEQHGDWLTLHSRVAAVWSGFLGAQITAKQAALMMAQYKTVRADEGAFNPDDFRDIAGYAGGAGEIAAREQGVQGILNRDMGGTARAGESD